MEISLKQKILFLKQNNFIDKEGIFFALSTRFSFYTETIIRLNHDDNNVF